jgi:hypothetical protein
VRNRECKYKYVLVFFCNYTVYTSDTQRTHTHPLCTSEAQVSLLDAQALRPKSKLPYKQKIFTLCAPLAPKEGTPTGPSHVASCFQEKVASTGQITVAAHESAKVEEAAAFP